MFCPQGQAAQRTRIPYDATVGMPEALTRPQLRPRGGGAILESRSLFDPEGWSNLPLISSPETVKKRVAPSLVH